MQAPSDHRGTIPTPPQPSAELLAEAKKNPGGWVYVIQGNFGPEDAVPPQCIVGAWKVGANGELTGQYAPNPNYRPPAA